MDYPAEQLSRSSEETVLFGKKLGEILERGSVVALSGCLGAGKTCFTRGIALALGIEENITSPTYTIVSEYEGRIPLRHIDAYRLASEAEFEQIGGSELFTENGVSVIEWPERIASFLPREAVFIGIALDEHNGRIIRCSKTGTRRST